MTIYVVIPPTKIVSHGPLIRLWLSILLGVITERTTPDHIHGRRTRLVRRASCVQGSRDLASRLWPALLPVPSVTCAIEIALSLRAAIPPAPPHPYSSRRAASKRQSPAPEQSGSTAGRCSPAAHRRPLELIRVLATQCTHQTPSR